MGRRGRNGEGESVFSSALLPASERGFQFPGVRVERKAIFGREQFGGAFGAELAFAVDDRRRQADPVLEPVENPPGFPAVELLFHASRETFAADADFALRRGSGAGNLRAPEHGRGFTGSRLRGYSEKK